MIGRRLTSAFALALVLCAFFAVLSFADALPVSADVLPEPQSESGATGLSAFADIDLSGKRVPDTGWPCGRADRQCCHILVNDSDFILCVPAERSDGTLMLPIEHFRLITGSDLDITLDGRLRLTKNSRSYILQADFTQLTRGGGNLAFPVAPYKVYGFTFVPLRFLCEAMELEVYWHDDSDTVLLSCPDVFPGSLPPYMRTINAELLKAIKDFEGPYGEPMDLIVTFYYSAKQTVYTASGYPAEAGTIAADISIPFGTRFQVPELSYIRADGIFTVRDRGRRILGNSIDIFIPGSMRSDPRVSAAVRRGRFTVTGYMLPPGDY